MRLLMEIVRANFNPRSREGSDGGKVVEWFDFDISIHAPARGATYVHLSSDVDTAISIHAPARGATYYSE